MTIDEAIKFLEEEIGRQVIYYGGTRDEAVKLGIEALKRVRSHRLNIGQVYFLPLPGEGKTAY